MEQTVILMNFTNAYKQEDFVKEFSLEWIDCSDLAGTSYFCDATSANSITKRIAPYSPKTIHFIDTGNHHYVSKFWVDRIKEPFSLIVFDYHLDVLPSLFDNILSCGCWIKKLLDTNPYLRNVYIIGANEELIRIFTNTYGDRLKIYGETELLQENGWKRFCQEKLEGSIYISIDKDVLNTNSAVTNWDQGSWSLTDLKKCLNVILRKGKIIGIDICGEFPYTSNIYLEKKAISINSDINKQLLTFFLLNAK